MSCPTGKCKNKCGKGTATVGPPNNEDPIFIALCGILCETRKEFCEGKHKGEKRSRVAEKKAAESEKLKKAMGKGKSPLVNKQRYVKFPDMPDTWKRTPVSPEQLVKQLGKLEKQFEKMVMKKLSQKAGKKLALAWTRFVPVVGWGMAAYDAYDLATTGVDLYKQWDEIKSKFTGDDIYRIRPDVAVVDENGRLKDIYDFKIDNPETGFDDGWNEGQEEMYNRALENDGAEPNAKAVEADACGCDLPKGAK